MPPHISRPFAFILVLSASMVFAFAEVPAKPLNEGDVLALVAGGALTENVVNEIKRRGLTFHPSNQYRSQLETAGAEGALLAALKGAQINVSAGSAGDKQQVESCNTSRKPQS